MENCSGDNSEMFATCDVQPEKLASFGDQSGLSVANSEKLVTQTSWRWEHAVSSQRCLSPHVDRATGDFLRLVGDAALHTYADGDRHPDDRMERFQVGSAITGTHLSGFRM